MMSTGYRSSNASILLAIVAAVLMLAPPVLGVAAPITFLGPNSISQTPVSAADPLPVTVISGGGGGGSGTEYTEDAAAVANPVGGTINCVRRDTLTVSEVSADGDWIACKVTSKGQLHTFTELVSGSTVAATQSGAWNVTNISGTVSLPTGAATAANQTTELGYLDGVEGFITRTQGVIGGATAPSYMSVAGGVYLSSTPTITNGQSAALRLDSHQSLVVTCANADGSLCGDISTVKTDQTTHGTTDLVAADITKIGGTTALAGLGNVGTGSQRVFAGFAGATQYTFSTTTAETIEVIPASGSLITYVVFGKLQVDGTVGFTWKYGTGTNCGTGTTTLEGPYPLTAQNGWIEGNGAAPVLIVPAGKALCRTTDAGTTRTTGKLLAVQF